MNFLLIGKKVGMTQVYDADNRLVPVTVVEVGPCPITQIKTTEKDGYNALQVAFQQQSEKRIAQPQQGHFKKAGVNPHRVLREIRLKDVSDYKVGDVLTVSKFEAGQQVDIIGTTKGRGFQGVMKRWNFAGGPASHGSMFHRRGGSYGQRQTPGEVYKGKEMPGHMGDRQRTVQNLRIVKVLEDKNLLLVKGSLPGANNSLVLVRAAKKSRNQAA